MNDMENNKYEELRHEIDKKYDALEALQIEIQQLEEDMEQYSAKNLDAVLEEANNLLNKYYLYYYTDDNCDEFNFCYCKKVAKTCSGVEIELGSRTVINGYFNMVLYYENPKAIIITSTGNYLRSAIPLDGKQAYDVCVAINKTICRELSVKDLHSFLKDMYNSID